MSTPEQTHETQPISHQRADDLFSQVVWSDKVTHQYDGEDGVTVEREGVLSLGGMALNVAVLSNGRRIFFGPNAEAMMGAR